LRIGSTAFHCRPSCHCPPSSAWGLLRVGALVVFPACAAVGGALAIIGRRLGLAAALVAVEPLVVMALIAGLVLTGNVGPWITIGR
jgi:hypothetical protein